MTALSLSLYDLTGIQGYIFSSNRLKENLGASYLASLALDAWLNECRARVPGTTLCWSGGGNAVVWSPDPKAFARALSVKVLEQAPGLTFACAHTPWDGHQKTWAGRVGELQKVLAREKAQRTLEPHFDGGGVVQRCAASGLPASALEQYAEGKRRVSATADARLKAVEGANTRVQSFFPLPEEWVYTDEVELLGASRGEHSFIGVIHFDGNRMGKRFKDILKASDPEAARQAYTTLAEGVDRAGKQTLEHSLRWLLERLPALENAQALSLQIDSSNKKVFPVRPIVYGGDDITLVCDGRIALDLAAHMLREWHTATETLPGEPAHACAGVALVKMRFPFSRAYELASDLCQNAKKYVRERNLEVSALDYEIHSGGPMLSVEQRRERFSTLPEQDGSQKLFARPYIVVGSPPFTEPYRDWTWFRESLVRTLQAPPWSSRSDLPRAAGPSDLGQDKASEDRQEESSRSAQLHQLASSFHKGPKAVERQLELLQHRFGLAPPVLPRPQGFSFVGGFAQGETPYLDALELMDQIVPWSTLIAPSGGGQ